MVSGNPHLEVKLDRLREALDSLGAAIGENLNTVWQRLSTQDSAPPKPLNSVDDLVRITKERCLGLVALQSPVARDLRFAMGALRVEHDYERIQELAQSLNQRAERLRGSPVQSITHDMAGVMAKIVELHNIVCRTWKRDQSESEKTTIKPHVDERCSAIRASIAEIQARTMEAITKGEGSAEMLVELVLACRHLKRIEGLLQAIPDELHSFD
jgi:phosphate transport system protein